jgi:TPR repeat protein
MGAVCLYLVGCTAALKGETTDLGKTLKLAEQGDMDAQDELGLKYYVAAWKPDREQEIIEAFYRAYGRPTSATYSARRTFLAQAAEWFHKAAKQGHAGAQYCLGYMHRHGYYVQQDDEQAVRWYRKAAEQGQVEAQYRLGEMYEANRGVAPQESTDLVGWDAYATRDKRRYAEAARWFQKAAEQGHPGAQFDLGFLCDRGDVPGGLAEAATWYRMGAEQGSAASQRYLGYLYAKPRYEHHDPVEAYAWFSLSGDYQSQVEQEKLEEKLTPEQLLAAQKRARELEAEIEKRGPGYVPSLEQSVLATDGM